MTSNIERIINIPGFSIAVKTWNTKQSKPVLCLHGKLDNAASFDLLAPHLPDFQLFAVDYPGTGLSSHYPEGCLPHWKNDAFLMIHLIKKLKWDKFDIIAHSLGSLLATIIAIALPQQVNKMVFLDILGPTVNFIEYGINYLPGDIATYLTYDQQSKTLFSDPESAIRDRMKIGNISFQAAQALVNRGIKQTENGWMWTFDRRLRCISSTTPYEDELQTMFKAIEAPTCLIRAKEGVSYPDKIFQARTESIKDLITHEIPGGHHVHMDDPIIVAKIISKFLSGVSF